MISTRIIHCLGPPFLLLWCSEATLKAHARKTPRWQWGSNLGSINYKSGLFTNWASLAHGQVLNNTGDQWKTCASSNCYLQAFMAYRLSHLIRIVGLPMTLCSQFCMENTTCKSAVYDSKHHTCYSLPVTHPVSGTNYDERYSLLQSPCPRDPAPSLDTEVMCWLTVLLSGSLIIAHSKQKQLAWRGF